LEWAPEEARPRTTSPAAIVLAVDGLGFFDDADRKAGQIVFASRVHARHFGGFATDQRAAGQFAALGDAADNRRSSIDIELAAGEVVEEEQRFGAEHENVIDAHGDQILTDRIVAVQVESQAQLGADAIGTGHQHRLLVALRHFEQRAETANTAEHAFAQGLFGKRFDPFDEFITRIDIDAGITVGKGSVLGHGQLAPRGSKRCWKKRRFYPKPPSSPNRLDSRAITAV
jgi:hypothetical protein